VSARLSSKQNDTATSHAREDPFVRRNLLSVSLVATFCCSMDYYSKKTSFTNGFQEPAQKFIISFNDNEARARFFKMKMFRAPSWAATSQLLKCGQCSRGDH
jgi:hypothetical protein